MSPATSEQPSAQKKTFGKSTREVPHHSQRAQKFYPAEDSPGPKKARKSIKPARPRKGLDPGTILILLAGRFRGKRVILLRNLPQGVLLVTGPFKINGVPTRRVNARYVITTKEKIDISGVDSKKLEEVGADKYFAREKGEKAKKGETEFFKQGEKPEKKKPSSSRASDQKAIDKTLLATIKKEPMLKSYLASTFSLRKGDRPHEMVW